MSDHILHVLFLCTGNSARSLMAECALTRWGNGRFQTHSAGSRPTGEPHPLAIAELSHWNYDTSQLRSKSWEEFSGPDAPPLDFVFTVCDNAAAEACPAWPGQPMTAHWGAEDPAAATGSDEERQRVFRRVYTELENRIKVFVSLPLESLDRLSLQRRLDDIGKG